MRMLMFASNLKQLHPTCKFLFKYHIIMGLLCWRIEAASPFSETYLGLGRTHVCYKRIHRVRNQGKCLSSWAIAAASVMSDRLCIASYGNVTVDISSEDLLTCCQNCQRGRHTCRGGNVAEALLHYNTRLTVTEGCKPYSTRSFNGEHVPCTHKCTNPKYKTKYFEDGYYGISNKIPKTEAAIRREIMTRGPVIAGLKLYDDFLNYTEGTYRHRFGKYRHQHYVKIIGWSYTIQKGKMVKWWLAINSFGSKWGLNGTARIERGANECGIEDDVWGCWPKLRPKFNHDQSVVKSTNSVEIAEHWQLEKHILLKLIVAYMYNCLYK